MTSEERLITCFTELFKILKIEYKHFNTIYEVETDEQKQALVALEKKYPELGIIGTVPTSFHKIPGVSTVSLMATISDFLCRKRFGVNLNGPEKEISDRKIEGISLLDYKKKD